MSAIPLRVSYREGQPLRAADLTAEQEYLIAFERRHNLGQHLPGVVAGLGRGEGGVAVNAAGQLLVVDDAAAAAPACNDLWLIHCEMSGPPCTPRRDRISEIARVVAVNTQPRSPLSAPTADAVYLGRFGCDKDPRDPEYTSLSAASVKDPAGRASMQIGPASATDRNGFLISTASPRIALDRFGNNRFTGTVTLADYHYCELMRLTNDKVLMLKAKAPGASGATLHLLITPSRANNVRRLTFQAYSGTKRVGDPAIWDESNDFVLDFHGFRSMPFLVQAVPSLRFALLNPNLLRRPAIAAEVIAPGGDEARPPHPPKEVFDRFTVETDVPLHPCGGSLRIDDWPKRPDKPPIVFRGCDDVPAADDDPPRDPPGLSFVAMKEAPKAPPIPGIYSVRAGDAKNPIEELRIDLGEKRDGDLSARLALGARDGTADPLTSWLEVNGVAGVTLPYPNPPAAPKPPVSVHVDGTIQRGPIKPDMSDPTFTNLMALAWLAGLQKGVVESQVYNVTFTLPAHIVDSDDEFDYDINVKNPTFAAITVEGYIETLTVPNENPHIAPHSLKPPATIFPSSTGFASKAIHLPQDLSAGTIKMKVVAYGKHGGAWWWKSHEDSFRIAAAPSVDKSGIPDSVPPGTPFDATVEVTNNDDQDSFTVHTVTIGNVALNPAEPFAPGHQSSYTTHQAGINADTDLAIVIDMTWQDNTPNPFNDTATVKVRDDIDVSIGNVQAPDANHDVAFDVTVKNVGNKTLTNLDVERTSNGAAMLVQHATLHPGDQLSVTTKIPQAAHSVDLRIVYDRDGQTWHLPVQTKGVP